MPKSSLKIGVLSLISFIPRVIKILEINLYNPRNHLLKLGGLVFTQAPILSPNLNICQRILSQPSIEDISKFPTLEIKSKIKIQKGKLIFVHAPHSETAHTIRKFSQNRSELISKNSKIGAHLISDGLICGGQLSHLRRQASR